MLQDLKGKKIALVHDYLLRIGGAERVLKVLHEMFPDAPIYCVTYDTEFVKSFLGKADIKGSFLQKLPAFFRKRYKYFSFFIPAAVESLDLSEYDVVISSSSAFSKGVITRPDSVHICYCHTPTRFLWDWTHPYSASLSKRGIFSLFSKTMLHILRLWDQQAAKRVDYFVANSEHVAKRIKKYYRRDSLVIYPPVQISDAKYPPAIASRAAREALRAGKILNNTKYSYYLIVSQLRPYKQIDIAIEAFKKLGFSLVIVGRGNDAKRLKRLAKGYENIKFAGYASDEEVCEYYKNCRAFIFSGEEDFGITMVEAMSFGKPVLALREGGAKEIVLEGKTGEFFNDAHPVVLADGVRRLNENFQKYDSGRIKKQAEKFSRENFEKNLGTFILDVVR